MTRLLLPILLSFWSLSALGQAPQRDSTRARAGARLEVRYADAQGQKLPSAQGADHRTETAYTDSVKGVERVFYASGQLKSYTPYLNVRRHFRHGRCLEYYESGQLHRQEDVIANKPEGDFLVFYPDGKLRRRDHFEVGKRTTGECFGPDGQPVAYFEYKQRPVYSEGDGGIMAIVTAIQQRIRYPAEALRHRLAGTIKVKFIVSATGEVGDVTIIGGVDESQFQGSTLAALRELEATVVQAVRHLKRFTPGQQDGENVAVAFTAPISFKIQ